MCICDACCIQYCLHSPAVTQSCTHYVLRTSCKATPLLMPTTCFILSQPDGPLNLTQQLGLQEWWENRRWLLKVVAGVCLTLFE
jgi:hypothetical protein